MNYNKEICTVLEACLIDAISVQRMLVKTDRLESIARELHGVAYRALSTNGGNCKRARKLHRRMKNELVIVNLTNRLAENCNATCEKNNSIRIKCKDDVSVVCISPTFKGALVSLELNADRLNLNDSSELAIERRLGSTIVAGFSVPSFKRDIFQDTLYDICRGVLCRGGFA